MIVSASYRTDIPTFYGQWFMNRVRAGYCKTYNAFSHRAARVSLNPETVDAFVFWTKNAGPFIDALAEIRQLGFPFVIQHTVTGYPRELEASVTPARTAALHFRQVADSYGSNVMVWRYDPILLSTITPVSFHIANFEQIAAMLEGCTDEVVVSFTQMYRKTERNLTAAAEAHGFGWQDPDVAEKKALLLTLSDVAGAHGMSLRLCSQPEFLPATSVKPARCVDVERISRVAGLSITTKTKGNRRGCLCARAVDIGAYDTCPHGCVYCYAVQNQQIAKAAYKQHDPDGEYLFPPTGPVIEEAEALRLFEV